MREKQRRLVTAEKFKELAALTNLDEKTDKLSILCAAVEQLKLLVMQPSAHHGAAITSPIAFSSRFSSPSRSSSSSFSPVEVDCNSLPKRPKTTSSTQFPQTAFSEPDLFAVPLSTTKCLQNSLRITGTAKQITATSTNKISEVSCNAPSTDSLCRSTEAISFVVLPLPPESKTQLPLFHQPPLLEVQPLQPHWNPMQTFDFTFNQQCGFDAKTEMALVQESHMAAVGVGEALALAESPKGL